MIDFNDEVTWQERARDQIRRRAVRERNAEHPEEPECCCCGGTIRGSEVANGHVFYLAERAARQCGQNSGFAKGDVLCFDCWFAFEPDIAERFEWGNA